MWMREQELDDDLIQSYSGNESKESLKIYAKLEVANSKNDYNKIMEKFPI